MSVFHDPAVLMQKARQQLQEKEVNPYAVGMAAAMKSTGDKPPLEKSTINKAHKIAKSIQKNGYEAEGEVVDEKVGLSIVSAGEPNYDRNKQGEVKINPANALRFAGKKLSKAAGVKKKIRIRIGEAITGGSAPNVPAGVAKFVDELPQKVTSAAKKVKKVVTGEEIEIEVINHLIENGFAETEENAQKIMDNMSESWVEEILSELSLGQIGGAIEKTADTYVKPNLERIGAQKGRERMRNLPVLGDIGAAAGRQQAGRLYDTGKDAVKKGDVNTAIKTGRTALDMLRNSYEHEVYADELMERENDEPGESDNRPDVKAHNRAVKYRPRPRRPRIEDDPRYGTPRDGGGNWKY